VLEARSLAFGHARRERPVLRSCDLRVAPGDRVLLTGPSGAGKSTLASILAGLRTPRSGLLLLSGLDPSAFPEDAWRRRVVLVPQFHENHVLAGTLAFNLLLGRSWPPAPQDLADAEATCRGLGLQPLLDRMPAGLQQTVGETGWQLSHGERTRLYLARALLQRPDVVLLDESFAAIDPLTLEGVVRFVAERAPALVVMEHR
jgi:ATP-binding cassette subfamily B protein